jgi:hypothetical protein
MLFANENHKNILALFIGSVLNKTVTKAAVLDPNIPRNLQNDKENRQKPFTHLLPKPSQKSA